jgi:hypothetical protein
VGRVIRDRRRVSFAGWTYSAKLPDASPLKRLQPLGQAAPRCIYQAGLVGGRRAVCPREGHVVPSLSLAGLVSLGLVAMLGRLRLLVGAQDRQQFGLVGLQAGQKVGR